MPKRLIILLVVNYSIDLSVDCQFDVKQIRRNVLISAEFTRYEQFIMSGTHDYIKGIFI